MCELKDGKIEMGNNALANGRIERPGHRNFESGRRVVERIERSAHNYFRRAGKVVVAKNF